VPAAIVRRQTGASDIDGVVDRIIVRSSQSFDSVTRENDDYTRRRLRDTETVEQDAATSRGSHRRQKTRKTGKPGCNPNLVLRPSHCGMACGFWMQVYLHFRSGGLVVWV